MTKYLQSGPITFPPPRKTDGMIDLDIWARPIVEVKPEGCPHTHKVYTVCAGWRCGDCGERV